VMYRNSNENTTLAVALIASFAREFIGSHFIGNKLFPTEFASISPCAGNVVRLVRRKLSRSSWRIWCWTTTFCGRRPRETSEPGKATKRGGTGAATVGRTSSPRTTRLPGARPSSFNTASRSIRAE
jgi:hypothetical protein